jgi:hypothetical protein
MTDTTTLTMWGTLVPVMVGGAIGLVGGWLGPWLVERRKEAAEKKKRRAEKFEELVAAVVEHFHWMANIRYFYISGQGSLPTSLSPITKIDAIASTYFPEFEKLVRQLDSASNKYEMWILNIGQKRVRNEPGYESLTAHDEVITPYTDIRAEFLMELRNFARREFQ